MMQQEEEKEEEKEEEEEGEGAEEDVIPKPDFKPPPVIPKEDNRLGANKFVYFVCNEPGTYLQIIFGSSTFRQDHFGADLFGTNSRCFLLTLTQTPNPK